MSVFSIEHVKISGLFGEYDYSISFHRDITIITSPNGYGKTTILKAIDLFAQKKFYTLKAQIIFNSLEFVMSDGYTYKIENINDHPKELLKIHKIHPESNTLTYTIFRVNIEDLDRQVTRYLPWLTRVSETEWIHDETREIFSDYKVYGQLEDITLKTNNKTSNKVSSKNLRSSPVINSLPDWLSNLNTQVMVIPTDRLQRQIDDPTLLRQLRNEFAHLRRNTPMSSYQSSVRVIAEKIKRKYEYTIQGQFDKGRELESSFVHRLLNRDKHPSQISIESLQNEIRTYEERFFKVGLIQSLADLKQSEQVGAPYQEVISLYYQDIIEKFKLMESFADKLQNFVDTLNSLYTNKTLKISSDGLKITSIDNLDLDSLSSGEKHVLVMFGTLFFDTTDDMLLLIDEPEISLHPVWQERFLEIVQNIQSQHRNVKVIMATHSPLIFGNFIDSNDIIDLEIIEGQVC